MYNISTQESIAAEGGHPETIAIRSASPEDAAELRRIAERDTASVPAGRLLLAVVAGEPRAALSLTTGESIADPFYPTGGAVRLLRERAAQLGRPAGWRARLRERRLRRSPRRALSPQPAGTLRAFD